MTPLLTPGLTPHQRQRVADILIRTGAAPTGELATMYCEADVTAARFLNDHTGCHIPVAPTFLQGFAIGLRLGRTFAPLPRPRSKWISDEYRRLSEASRRDVQRYIRRLLRLQNPPPPKAPPAPVEVEAARTWAKKAGRLAWAQHTGKPVEGA